MQKVLIIEDHADMRELLSWQIELMGFMPILAKHGKEGIEKAIAEKPELILMDIMMPEMDGLESSRRIRREFAADAQPRIIAMTANAMLGDRELCLAAGMDDYVSKPVRREELVDALSRSKPLT